MENPADLEAVRGFIERPLTSDEERVIPAWLAKAWRELKRVVPGIPTRVALPEDDPAHLDVEDVSDVLVAMVERKIRNAGGTSEWRDDLYSEKVDPSLASGRIYVTDEERDKLMPPAPTYGNAIHSIPLTAI
ncbi:hypothetical protein [Microbacterium arborescens]